MTSRLVAAAVAALVVLLAGPGRAPAEQIVLSFTGNANGTQAVLVNGSLKTAPVGPFGWTVDYPPDASLPSPLTTFCVELSQPAPVSPGDSAVFRVESNLAGYGPIGSKENAIRELFAENYTAAATVGGDYSKAFQIALWDLLTDGVTTNPAVDPLATGNFQIPGAGNTNALNLARGMIHGTAGDHTVSFTGTPLQGQELVVLVSPASAQDDKLGVQDHIALRPGGEVPAPAGAVLAGIGLLGLLGRARLLRRKPTA